MATFEQVRPVRFRTAAGVVCAVASCAVAVTGILPPVASAAPTVVRAGLPAGLRDKIHNTADALEVAANAVTKAKIAADDANKQLPGVERKLAEAQNKVGAAVAAEARAQADVAAARRDIVKQRAKIERIKAQIEALRLEIGRLGRQAYIDGGDYQELQLLMDAESPSDLAAQVQAFKRQARGNSGALTRMAKAKIALNGKLAELKALEDKLRQREQDAISQAGQARAAAEQALRAKVDVAELIAQRTAAAKSAAVSRAKIRSFYTGLVKEQRRRQLAREMAAAEEGVGNAGDGGGPGKIRVPWAGQSAAAQSAVAFVLSKVGADYASGGGQGPAYDCVGLMWRAWNEAGSKLQLMQVQDTAHSRWVKLIPRSQAKPGDLIMWHFGNGTDWRPNALDHVGMVINPRKGQFVQAESSRTGVRFSNWFNEGFYSSPTAFGRVVG